METNTLEQDVELIRRCQAGDDSAFNVLYSRYRLQLYSYLNKLLPNDKSHIDDFFQQTWIKAFNNFGRYNDQQRFLAWICRIAHNQVMDFFRRQKGTVMVELDDHLPGGFDTADKVPFWRMQSMRLSRRFPRSRSRSWRCGGKGRASRRLQPSRRQVSTRFWGVCTTPLKN